MRTLLAAAVMGLTSLLTAASAAGQQNPEGIVRPNTAAVKDLFRPEPPKSVRLEGLLGERFDRSETNRLLKVNEDELLAGFRKRPGSHPWIGEHVGKWLHAAGLTYASSGSAALRAKLDRVARALMAAQEPDGYLGTYVPEKRFGLYPEADWDVWVHKYNLLGLLTYYQYTGNMQALQTCRRIGDLLLATFGPDKKSILSAGTHVGMASTSVLEPMVLLYRATGETKYLDFARYITEAWEKPTGPKIISTLMREKSVRKTANAKAYEMLSNLAGLCELYRVTGERRYLEPVLIAWEDIARRRLYITGTGSSHELWQEENHLPNGVSANLGETCVTVTWEQLNLQLLRLLGQARFADQIERSVYNHLLGAQKPTADAWCYYTPLVGAKPYGSSTNCCLSSGPRGVALLPSIAVMAAGDGPVVNLYTAGTSTVRLVRGAVLLTQATGYPLSDTVQLTITPRGAPSSFTLRLRSPGWTPSTSVSVNGKPFSPARRPDGYLALTRAWKPGDTVTLKFDLAPRLVPGHHMNEGRAVVTHGPLVLAADTEHNPDLPALTRVALKADTPASLKLKRVMSGSIAGEPVWETPAVIRSAGRQRDINLRLTPFYAAGQSAGRYVVWINRAGSAPAPGLSLFSQAEERRSRQGNVEGSIVDDDPSTFVVTFDNTMKDEDWYEVSLQTPAEIDRVVFAHGHCFHDGGWFDSTGGKPKVLIKKESGGAWLEVGTLEDYPATTASDPAGLKDGQLFTARITPVRVVAVRVVGRPASGDNSRQAFSSCGELQAFRQ